MMDWGWRKGRWCEVNDGLGLEEGKVVRAK